MKNDEMEKLADALIQKWGINDPALRSHLYGLARDAAAVGARTALEEIGKVAGRMTADKEDSVNCLGEVRELLFQMEHRLAAYTTDEETTT
jgi:hypothetical protein